MQCRASLAVRAVRNERKKRDRLMEKAKGLSDQEMMTVMAARAQLKAKAKPKAKGKAKAKAKG